MGMNYRRIHFLALLMLLPFFAMPQGLKSFKLKNGMNVYVWEDASQPDVLGMVVSRTGSFNDPENLTGLAHYLEHVLFKGTDRIGTLDWLKEKPIYDHIISKYDEMAKEPDAIKKGEIAKEINQLTVEASQYSISNEFSNLTEGMGGKGLNAGTSYDMTVFYNSFPSYQIGKWLELNSSRLISPVFRAFQSELETVYEEYNMYQDSKASRNQEFLMQNIFSGPYARPIIGEGQHLKNPQLSQLIGFYNQWYTPNNMALILVGNVQTKELLPLISKTFGRLEQRNVPEQMKFSPIDFQGRKEITAKIGTTPQVYLAFNGVKTGDSDEIAMDVCTKVLSNSSKTGSLDKLTIDGDVMAAGAYSNMFRQQGKTIITSVPYYDPNQRRFVSLKSTEKLLLQEIEKLSRGEVDQWLLESVKNNMCRTFDLNMESSSFKANTIAEAFVCNQEITDVVNYVEKVNSITKEDIQRVAKKYLNDNYLAIYIQEGKPEKGEKISKPKYKPIESPKGVCSEYAKWFKELPINPAKEEYCDFSKVQTKNINEKTKLFYSPNIENNVFTLTLKYGVGTAHFPKLGIAAQLMNNAGIMAQFEPHEFKKELSKLNASCSYACDDSYVYISINGTEENLAKACNLITRQILMPKLEEKQINNIKGQLLQQRIIEKDNVDVLEDALSEYLYYQKSSDYIDRLSESEIIDLNISSLTGDFQRATNYPAEVHYVGNLPFDDVVTTLSQNLPLKESVETSDSPVIKDHAKYSENTIYFLPENDAQQSKIYFFIEGVPYQISNDFLISAFNQYIGGGFTGLILEEIREKNSMAYTSYGLISNPPIQEKNNLFRGFIGTQNDKTIDAISLYLKILNEFPLHPERMDNIRNYLRQSMLANKPNFRNASFVYEGWKKKGYSDDPAKTNVPKIDTVTMEDISNFYTKTIKGKPVSIAIVGNPNTIDMKKLETFGKVIRLSKSKIFSSEK